MDPKKMRWGLMAVFPLTYFVVGRVVRPGASNFALLTVLNAGACALLLSQLGGPAKRTLWAWIPLLVFLDGYFLKMTWFAHKLDSPYYINRNYPELRWVSDLRIVEAYPVLTIGFVTFCLAAFLLLLRLKPSHDGGPLPDPEQVRRNSTFQLAAFISIGYLLASMLQFRVGYGFAGLANPALPAGLGTLLTLFRRGIVPGLLLLCVWAFGKEQPKRAAWVAVVILGCGIVDSMISTSRSSVVHFIGPVFVLWGLTGKFNWRRGLAAGGAIFIALILVPIVSAIRVGGITGSSGDVVVAPSVESLTDSAVAALGRAGAGGIDGVWHVLNVEDRDFSVPRLLRFVQPRELTAYFTHSVVRVARPNDFRAPGLIAAFLLIGGSGAVVVLMTVLVGSIHWTWECLRRLRTAPVALALASDTIFSFVADGTLDAMLFVKLLAVAVVCEAVYRSWIAPRTTARSIPAMAPAA